MVINTNIVAANAANQLANSSSMLAKSLQRLSSGSKIASPEDDPAGLGVSMQFQAQIGDIGAAQNNVSDATSFTQTQDGYLQQVSTALDQMSQLAISAQDSTKTDSDRSLYQAEFSQLASYVGNIASKQFNGVSLFSANGNAVTIDGDGSSWSMTAVNLNLAAYTGITGGSQTVATTAGAGTAYTAVQNAITQLATDRANIGANEARLSYTSNQLSVEQTNISAANSAISDVDIAAESTNYAKLQILVQSGTAMLAQANVMPQSVLKLLS